jgi:hypothetical protein
MEVFLIFIGFAFVALIIRLIAGSVDHDRVEEYISERGGRVIEKNWSPFGKGWFGSENERIYEVKYEDKDGNIHKATCKTSLFSGVYFTQDEIVELAGNTGTMDRETELEIENRQLKQQIEDLKRET